MKKEIRITDRKQMDIYMNPQRQRILKTMELQGTAMTPKQLSGRLGISASSVTHHLGKLMELGLIALDHTELIHGIQARYYKRLPVSVSLCGNLHDDLSEERELLADYTNGQIWKDFLAHVRKTTGDADVLKTGDSMNGVLYLDPTDAKKLFSLLQTFIQEHSRPGEGRSSWEYSFTLFPYSENEEADQNEQQS